MTYFVIKKAERVGPYSLEQVAEQIHRGELTLADLGWREGLVKWLAFRDMPEIAKKVLASNPATAFPASTSLPPVLPAVRTPSLAPAPISPQPSAPEVSAMTSPAIEWVYLPGPLFAFFICWGAIMSLGFLAISPWLFSYDRFYYIKTNVGVSFVAPIVVVAFFSFLDSTFPGYQTKNADREIAPPVKLRKFSWFFGGLFILSGVGMLLVALWLGAQYFFSGQTDPAKVKQSLRLFAGAFIIGSGTFRVGTQIIDALKNNRSEQE